MALHTKGTELFVIDPANGNVIDVGCVTAINGIDTTVEQIETTCLASLARTYQAGLATPGTANFTINSDPQDSSHIRLHQLKVAGADLKWAVGWGDGVAPPTQTTGTGGAYEFNLPDSRSWIEFDGFMNSFPFDFGLNAMVTSNVGIQVSGEPVWTPAGTPT